MKINLIGMMVALALPVLAAPPTGLWETGKGDFSPGSWTEVLNGGTTRSVGNEFKLAGDAYTLAGALVQESTLAETGFDFQKYVTTCSGGALVMRNTELDSWINPDDPNATFTVNLQSMEVTEWVFTDPRGQPTGERELEIKVAGVADDDATVEIAYTAGFSGTPGLDSTLVPNVLFGALEWAEIAVTRPVVKVVVDIKPGSTVNPVNLDSRGVIPVAIMGSADFDVTRIDVSTIRLEGVAPLRTSVGDVAIEESEDGDPVGDGFADLKLKFKTPQFAAVLKDAARNDRVTLTLTAELVDGTQVEGADTIRVLRSNRNPAKPRGFLKPRPRK